MPTFIFPPCGGDYAIRQPGCKPKCYKFLGDLQDYSGDLRAWVGSFGPTLKPLLGRHRLVTRPLRLIGLGASHLRPPTRQMRWPW